MWNVWNRSRSPSCVWACLATLVCVCGPHCGLGCDFALPFGGLDWSPALNVSSGAAVDVAAKQLHISLPRSISSWLQKERIARKGARGSVGLVCETVSLLFFSFTAGLHLWFKYPTFSACICWSVVGLWTLNYCDRHLGVECVFCCWCLFFVLAVKVLVYSLEVFWLVFSWVFVVSSL